MLKWPSRLAFVRRLSITTGVRLATLVSRSVLLIYMARYLDPAQLGQYGLVSATIAYGVLAFGLEYHFYNTRQILSQDDAEGQALSMRNQLLMHAIVTPLALPLLLVVFAWGGLPWQVAPFFYVILIMDHVAQELMRFAMTLQRPMVANVTYLLRNAWIYPVVALGIAFPATRSLVPIWIGWILGSGLGVCTGLYFLRGYPWSRVLRRPFDLAWTLRGFRVCAPYMMATLSSMALPMADRYAVKAFDSVAMVGIYTFYAAISGAVQSLVHANVGMLLYPRTVQAYLQNNLTQYRVNIRRLAWQSPAMAAFFALGVALVIYPLLAIVGRAVYRQYLPVLWIGLAGMVLAAAAEAPHAALYVRHQDIRILMAEVATAIIGLTCLYFLVPLFGVYGAALSVSLAWLSLYLIRGGLLLSLPASFRNVQPQ